MTCYHPKDAWRVYFPEYGHTSIQFRVSDAQKAVSDHVPIPCRKCIGCRIDYGRQWTVRLMHEAQMQTEDSVFITLTFDDKHLSKDGSIQVSAMQQFHKSLRQLLSPIKYRHYTIGEYGDKYGRPHYHSIIFGHDFPEKVKHKYLTKYSDWMYTSELLTNCWGNGYCTIQPLVRARAAYITGYVTKKLNGPKAAEYKGKTPEFANMSNQPGLGNSWFLKFYKDLFPSDFVILDGKRFPMPPYYDRLYAFTCLYEHEEVIDWRIYNAICNPKDRTPEALARREEYATLIAARSTRNLDK